jgi:hypothetical protein
MSDLVKQARSLLAADSSVTSIVSTRISALFREELDALPCIIIDVASVDPDAGTGLSGTASMIRGDLTITCFAETLSVCVDLAQKSAAALGGQRGLNSDGKAFAATASISVDSVSAALGGGSSGPFSLDVESELYLAI